MKQYDVETPEKIADEPCERGHGKGNPRRLYSSYLAIAARNSGDSVPHPVGTHATLHAECADIGLLAQPARPLWLPQPGSRRTTSRGAESTVTELEEDTKRLMQLMRGIDR